MSLAEDHAGGRPPALELRGFGLAHRREGGDLPLLENVDLTVPAGGFYLLVGESGGGKSSLLRLLAGLLEPREPPPRVAGTIAVLGHRLVDGHPRPLRSRVAAILQEEGLLDELTPRANVEMGLRAAGRSRKLALALMAQVGLDPPPDRVAVLSGGMRKRLAVARALAAEPELLICDEPTTGLDPEASSQLARLLHDSHLRAAHRRTTLVITHDVRAFAGLPDGLIVLDRNQRSIRLVPPDTAWRGGLPEDAASPSPDVEPVALHGLRRQMLAVAGLADTIVKSLWRLPPVELGQVARTTVRYALEPALFVVLAGAVIGGLATFFALRNNPIEGAFEGAVLTGSGKVLTAVLVPLLAGFFFTARMAAGAAARLGTMKRTHQVSALTMMGIQPADYLLTPLVWAMTLAMPVITLAGCVAAALASLAAAHLVSGISMHGWAAHYFFTVDGQDLRLVAIKACLSGYLVAVVTYHLATGPKRSGREVGDAVNASIVAGMALILAVHAVLTFAHYS